MIIVDVIRSAAQHMLLDFEKSKNIQHPGTKGRAREYAVIEQFLQPYLPDRFGICAGIVIDANSQQSKQQDLVVYDKLFSPKLWNMGADQVLFIESVLAVLEVKSKLDRRGLKDICEKCASIWKLSKSPSPIIALMPQFKVATSYPQVLGVGICFETSLALDTILQTMRRVRNEVEFGYALSILCVLQDKNKRAGLVINVSADNLRQIQLIPSPSDRLSLFTFKNPGDALLSLYLLLMEHLRTAGYFTPGPDFIHYARLAGFQLPTLQVPMSEATGALVEWEGRKLPIDILEKFRLLSKVVMQGTASDNDILEWFTLLPQMPSGEALLRPEARFYANTQVITDMPGPLEVYQAIERYQRGIATEADKSLIGRFIALIRSIYPHRA